MKTRSRIIGTIVSFFCLLISAEGAMLTDAEIYFDPDGLAAGFYSNMLLPDLLNNNAIAWQAEADPVTDADILPVLKDRDYGPGYVFSQDDYFQTPNVDYYADLTNGSLTATFEKAGLYHVRLTRQSGAEDIYAVFAQAGHFGDEETAPPKNCPVPDADLFVVLGKGANDAELDRGAKVIDFLGKNVERAANKQDILTAIENAYKKDNKKKHVEILAHGKGNGQIDFGDMVLDKDNAKAFQEEIDQWVNNLTFLACWAGEGEDGGKMLQALADSIGKTSGWSSWVGAYEYHDATGKTTDGWFYRDTKGVYVPKVPEPTMIFLLGLGGLGLLRKRRA